MPEDRAPRNSGAQGQESGPWGQGNEKRKRFRPVEASGGVGAKGPRVEKNRAIII